MSDKSKEHDKEIKDIRTEFGEFKKTISTKIDELLERVIKPIFSDKQIISIIIGIVVYLVIAVSYVTKTDARSIENYNNIEKSDEKDEIMMELLLEIKEIVDINKGKDEARNEMK